MLGVSEGDCVTISSAAPFGVAEGVSTGIILARLVGVLEYLVIGPVESGVAVGTGVSRLYAIAVERSEISVAAGSRSLSISLMIAKFCFENW